MITNILKLPVRKAIKITSMVVVFTTAVVVSTAPAFSQQSQQSFKGAAHDAWLTGKIETVLTLNTMLNSFTIDTDVDQSNVLLTGTVSSDVEKSLATELVRGVEGVEDIDNQLEVTGKPGVIDQTQHELSEAGDTLSNWVSNATITATIKSKLLANSDTSGLSIDVDTNHQVVTLSGDVSSPEESELAETIAANTSNVMEVTNNLMIVASDR